MISLIRNQSATVDELLRARNSWKAAELIGTLTTQIEDFTMTASQRHRAANRRCSNYKFCQPPCAATSSLLQDRYSTGSLPLPGEPATRTAYQKCRRHYYGNVMSGANPSP